MWKFCYFESQSWSGSFSSCRIGFWIRNDFVHVRGRRKMVIWFLETAKTEFLSLSGISTPSIRCGFVILQARFIPPLWFHGNTELHQKIHFPFSYKLKTHFWSKCKNFLQVQSYWREPRLISVNRSWFESIYSKEKIIHSMENIGQTCPPISDIPVVFFIRSSNQLTEPPWTAIWPDLVVSPRNSEKNSIKD